MLAELESLDEAVLRAKWTEIYGHAAPARLSRALLLRAVAYHAQTKYLGGIRGAVRRRLLNEALESPVTSASSLPLPATRLSPGAILVREWHGHLHHVRVVDQGFEYRDVIHRSLSQIARQITGSHWSGPAFFGLRKRTSRQAMTESTHGERA